MKETLGDSFSKSQMEEAAKRAHYDPEKAVAWLLNDEDHDLEEPFEMDIEDRSGDDIVIGRQSKAFTQQKGDTVNPKAFQPVQKNPTPAKQPSKPVQSTPSKSKLSAPSVTATPKTPSASKKDKDARAVSKLESKVSEMDLSDASEGGSGSGVSLSSSSGSVPRKPIRPQMSVAARQKIEAEIQALEGDATRKIPLNLVVVGHVDAGKSTIMGHLLYQLGDVDKKEMHRYERDSKRAGKSSFSYAWVLDTNEEERSRGVTMDVSVNYFETPTKRITLLDAPGHRDFVSNMITGASQADAAVLVLNASIGEFERGFLADGQTREHALLIRSLGVEQLIVAVNKLDTVDWSQSRFNEIVSKVSPFLKQAGFREEQMVFVPISGWAGDNLTELKPTCGLCAWYSGPTLLGCIDKLQQPVRLKDKPFRMCVSDVYKSQSLGITVAGKIEGGFVGIGDCLMLVPHNEICTVKALTSNEEPVKWAAAGENVQLGLQEVELSHLRVGSFLCDPEKPVVPVRRFQAKILTLESKFPIIKGRQVMLQYQNVEEPANITRLISILDKKTGEIKQKGPRSLPDGGLAIVEITAAKPVCIELYSDYKQLGRFTLRDKGATIATGVVTKLDPTFHPKK